MNSLQNLNNTNSTVSNLEKKIFSKDCGDKSLIELINIYNSAYIKKEQNKKT